VPITLDLRQAVIHKIHGKNEDALKDMIEGSIDAQETALPGLGVVFEIIWKNLDEAKQDNLVSLVHDQLEATQLRPLK
jgi:small acid-soluble spore protein I (minor)